VISVNLPFHLLATAGLAATLVSILRSASPSFALRAALRYGAFGVLASLITARAFPELPALAAWGLFLYAPLGLVVVAAGLARRRATGPRIAAALCALTAFAVAAVAVQAFFIEPQSLEVNRFTVESATLRRPLRIAVVADLQADRIGAYERAAIRRLRAERPDLVVLPGDYVQEGSGTPHSVLERELNALFRAEGLAAPRGVYAVRGDHEHDGWPHIFRDLPVRTFEATSTVVRDDVAVTGLGLRDSFATDLEVADRPEFHVVVGHRPDFALSPDVKADLLIAGHTHGGQVRLPFLGPIITLSQVPRAWAAGVTALPGGRTLVVSRGVGMTRGYSPRLRFLCRPEIVIVDVVPRQSAPSLLQSASISARRAS
jgi:hypothetical protein